MFVLLVKLILNVPIKGDNCTGMAFVVAELLVVEHREVFRQPVSEVT